MEAMANLEQGIEEMNSVDLESGGNAKAESFGLEHAFQVRKTSGDGSTMNKRPNRTNMSIAFLGFGSFLFVPLLLNVVTRLLLGSFDPLTDNAFNLSMAWISLIPGILTGIFLIRRRELGGGLTIAVLGIMIGLFATHFIISPPNIIGSWGFG
jgi:hypothetical protein